MAESLLRALIVDDEPIARRLTMLALTDEGFSCTPAVDGVDAIGKASHNRFDLIITDLCMPNKHGHALISELLARNDDFAPMVVVHSNVDDPRLTKDLMLRGVDDVVFKPTNYASFAAKLKGAIIRRQRLRDAGLPTPVEAVVADPQMIVVDCDEASSVEENDIVIV